MQIEKNENAFNILTQTPTFLPDPPQNIPQAGDKIVIIQANTLTVIFIRGLRN